MKQTIEYYYSVKVDDLSLENNVYHFILDNTDYYFVFFNRTDNDLKDIVECSKELKLKKINCHDILLNNNGTILTRVDDVNYILLRVNDRSTEYTISDIINQNKKTRLSIQKSDLYRNDWAKLWGNKIDYIESQINEVNCDKIIRKSVDYYIGLTENAIYYVNLINEKYRLSSLDKIVLSHKRIFYPNIALNYCNPLSYIFDLEVRDIAEYIKSAFFEGEDALLELKTYLKSVVLTPYSYNMLFARILYPSYYFDAYEKIVNLKWESEHLIQIISKAEAYEDFIKKAYQEISSYANLEKINWLIY